METNQSYHTFYGVNFKMLSMRELHTDCAKEKKINHL